MSAKLGDDEFYQNLLQYMNQSNSQYTFLAPMPSPSLSPHEAEKHGRDESMPDVQTDHKRRDSSNSKGMDSGSDETDQKPKKKPGRKMMMTEPVNKRKAQNRAAQRAFRERKEAHVKGLENRVTELEELTQNKEAENEALKNQVQALQAELSAIRGSHFDFDFTVKNIQNSNILPDGAAARNPFHQQNNLLNGQHTSPSPSHGSFTDNSHFRSGQSSLATSPENDINKNSTPNIDIPLDLFSNQSAGLINFNNPTNHTSPLFSTDLFGNSPVGSNGPRSGALFNQNQIQNTPPLLDTFASTLASLTQGQSPQNLVSSFNSSTMPSSTTTTSLSSFTPTSYPNLFDTNDPLFTTWRDNSVSTSAEDGFDIFDTMFSSMSPGAFNFVDTTGLTDFITDSPLQLVPQDQQMQSVSGETGITCPKLQEKLKNHPQLDDIDIDQLCAEMRSKAKCSNSGPILSSSDLEETISTYLAP